MRKLTKLFGCLRARSYRSALLAQRVAAAIEHEPILLRLALRTVVDIGANRGQFALVARRCFPDARIFSFEPLPVPAGRLRSVFAGDPRVTLHEAAIGPNAGKANIHISDRDDSSSLLPITAAQSTLFPGTAEIGTTTVKVAPLRDFLSRDQIEPPALLKLDVQGFELQTLKGCESLLHRFSHVYVECSFVELYAGQALADEVITWLRERGYRLIGFYNAVYDNSGRAIQADFLFASSAR